MGEVNVNKGLLIGLVAVAAASVLAVAFLLGRSSGSSQPVEQSEQNRVVVTTGPEARSAEAPNLLRTPAEAPGAGLATERPASETVPYLPEDRTGSQGATLTHSPPTVGLPTTTGGPTAATDPVATAVGKYLDAVDQIQPATLNGSPESVATGMAESLARGDSSGLDAMIRQTEAAREKLAALRPPAPCAAHYEKSLESFDDAVGMLRALKSSMESSDPAAGLAAVSARATILQTRAEALQNEDRALRQRYGLTR
jgi:hypothetical protein